MRVDRVCFITFRSVTFAQRGERVLRLAGVRCTLQRSQRWMQERGCGYALRLRTADIAGAVALLRKEQLPIEKVYCQSPDGKITEVAV